MRALVVHADPEPDGSTGDLLDAAVRGLELAGHDVEVLPLLDEGFELRMSAEERRAYHDDEPILDAQVRAHADAVRRADALVFVYPTCWFGLPALLKGWMERVLVTGVAFELHPRTRKVKGGLGHVRRLAAVTTYAASRPTMVAYVDGGRRTIGRTIRLICGWRCRTTWLGLYSVGSRTVEQRRAFADRVNRKMARL